MGVRVGKGVGVALGGGTGVSGEAVSGGGTGLSDVSFSPDWGGCVAWGWGWVGNPLGALQAETISNRIKIGINIRIHLILFDWCLLPVMVSFPPLHHLTCRFYCNGSLIRFPFSISESGKEVKDR